MTPTAEPAQGHHRATYREVLAEPRYRLLFSTRAVAITAGSLRITTFSVLVFAATGSALLSALAFGSGFLPQLFGSLLLGSLALPPAGFAPGTRPLPRPPPGTTRRDPRTAPNSTRAVLQRALETTNNSWKVHVA